ncbi:flavin reductase (NADPH) [Lingula anatina]|uniref:Flavin reductase (NADPH) n=1 Tax=Lingula anatina TaxID=7574 RepID=A0A1S3IEB4_LINAN|nr:flavin reductase (NADPH) [Lingula anatina]XP_013396499.1 flavin reductase (NADPH) [Lingula anatina]|eukprot:XP_013396498.1 flavin reductase (NADPH) [Lingula anatina]
MKRLVVLGATGPSGQEVVKQALSAGHHVTAVVRNPDKLDSVQNENLKVIKADVFSAKDLSEHFRGQEVVMSCLGNRDRAPVTLYTESMKAIVAAMRETGLTRLICITSWCTESRPGNPWLIEWVIKPLFIGKTVANMAEMEHYLFDTCQDINFTIVRPPGLGTGPVSDSPILTHEGMHVPGAPGGRMNRADVARFMLSLLDTSEWDRKAVAVQTGPKR